MKIIERFSASTKGDKTEDLIVETPHFFGVFDGVTGVKSDWLEDGRTMGQWASFLAGEALKALPAAASIEDFSAVAAAKMTAARKQFGLTPADRLASTAIILPRRRPLEVWAIGDSHYGYRLKDSTWKSCPQGKLYDDVTLAYRQIIVTQEILEKGAPQTQEERSALAHTSWNCIRDVLSKQILWANHGDPAEKLGFGVLCGTAVPLHHQRVYRLPDDTAEVVLCSDGLPEATATAEEGRELLKTLRETDPFLIGKNAQNFMGHKGGFVQMNGTLGDCYDDVAYLRIAV